MRKKIVAVVLAGGRGMRMGGNYKQFLKINGKELIFYSLDEFLKCDFIQEIILIVPREKLSYAEDLVSKRYKNEKKIKLISAVKTRQLSTHKALLYFEKQEPSPSYVIFHDVARPFVDKAMIESVTRVAIRFGGAVVGAKSVDLILEVGKGDIVKRTVRKSLSYCGYTPQCFGFQDMLMAHGKALKSAAYSFDNIELLEKYSNKFKIKVINWFVPNVKITYPMDAVLVKRLLKII